MPPGSMQYYTLVGFSAELDWRPVRFVKPLPPHRVCDACGLVRRWTALLPCMHTLCESCYELSTRDGGRVCPLDGQHCDDEDVFMKEFPVEELLRREVKCWNEGSDCSAVLPASQIGQHFQRECRRHSVRCPRCSARVLCSDVCAHLESECIHTTATPGGMECQENSGRKDETPLLTSFMQSLEAQAGALKALIKRVLEAAGANGDPLNKVVHGLNSCQETLREELRRGISSVKDAVRQEGAEVRKEHRESLKKCSGKIAAFSEETKGRLTASSDNMNSISNRKRSMEKLPVGESAKKARGKRDSGAQAAGSSKGATEQVGESSNAVSRMEKAVPRPPDLQASVCEFVVKGVESLERKARKEGFADYESERVYLRGYCMSPGVRFRRGSSLAVSVPGVRFRRGSWGAVSVHALFRLHKGDMDGAVRWPFQPRVKLRVVHPKGEEEPEAEDDTVPSDSSLERPQAGSVQGPYISGGGCSFCWLIEKGYVQDDQLRIKFEIGT